MDKKPYFPTNGTEGYSFIDRVCTNCKRAPFLRSESAVSYCSIVSKSIMEGGPIKQWVEVNGKAECTSFRHYKDNSVKKNRTNKNQINLF